VKIVLRRILGARWSSFANLDAEVMTHSDGTVTALPGEGWHNLGPLGFCFLFGGPPDPDLRWRNLRPVAGHRPARPGGAADAYLCWLWWSAAISWGAALPDKDEEGPA
jgi:hypothetical protein